MHFTTESFNLADRQLKSYTLQPRGWFFFYRFLGAASISATQS